MVTQYTRHKPRADALSYAILKIGMLAVTELTAGETGVEGRGKYVVVLILLKRIKKRKGVQ